MVIPKGDAIQVFCELATTIIQLSFLQKALRTAMCKNVLFAHLEADEQKAIFDAMFPVEKKKGEIIIEQVGTFLI